MKKIDVLKIVDKNLDNIIEDIAQVVKINSIYDEKTISKSKPYGNNIANMLDIFEQKIQSYSFDVNNIENKCLEVKIKGTSSKSFGIMSHLDTVPITNNWKTNPFELTRINDKFYGRGSSDNKGPSIMILWVLKMYMELNLTPKFDIYAIFGSDEERGSSDLDAYFKNHKHFDYGFSPDTDFPLIYLEKSYSHYVFKKENSYVENYDNYKLIFINGGTKINVVCDQVHVKIQCKNEKLLHKLIKLLDKNSFYYEILNLDIEFWITGVSAHAKNPIVGTNAIFKTAQFLKQIKLDKSGLEFISFINNYFTDDVVGKKLGIYEKDTHCSSTNNLAFCIYNENFSQLEFNYRSTISTNLEIINKKLTKIGKLYNFELIVLDQELPHFVDPESENVKILQKSYYDVLKKDVGIGVNGGRTYASKCKNTVAFGPLFKEDKAKIHSDEESISLRTIRDICAVYLQVLINISN